MRMAVNVLCLSIAMTLAAQTALPPPRRTDCLQWDQAYAQMVLFGLIGVTMLAFVAAMSLVLLAHRFWPLTVPRTRVIIGGTLALLLIEFGIVGLPRIGLLGRGIFASLDPRYTTCQSMSFGARGLIGGAVGKGVAAYAQWQAITLLLAGGAAVGSLLAWIVCEWLLSTRGLKAIAQGSES